MAKLGAPSKYDPDHHPQLAKIAAQAGFTDDEIAKELGISTRQLYRWKISHAVLCQSILSGKKGVDDRVEASLVKRAIGFHINAVKIMQYKGVPVVVPYKKYYPPSVLAGIFWLKNRRPDVWRENPVDETDSNERHQELCDAIRQNISTEPKDTGEKE